MRFSRLVMNLRTLFSSGPFRYKVAAPLLACSLGLTAFLGTALLDAARSWRQSSHEIASQDRVPFRSVRLEPSSVDGVEWISAPRLFRDAVPFQDRLYLSSTSALFEYDAEGNPAARYRVGLELPASPLVGLATGISPDSGKPALFISTRGEGLLTFDGDGFRQVRPEEAAYRKLTTVLPLATGRILLGTEKKGVLAYDGKQVTRFHPELADLHVTALAGDESSLWVGTPDRGVLHWRGGQVERFGEEEGLPDPWVLSLAVQGENVYVGTPTGVAAFSAGRPDRILAAGFFARSLLIREETLAVGTLAEGVVEVPLHVRPARRGRSSRLQGTPVPERVEKLLSISGQLHALAPDGLYAPLQGLENETSSWAPVVERGNAVLTDRNISALSVDGAGRLWVGYFDRGLDIVAPDGSQAKHVENEYVFCVNRILHNSTRNLTAVATANGLVFFDSAGRQRQVLRRSEGLITSHVTDVALSSGGLTVATPAGLTFLDNYDEGGPRSLYAFHGLVNNHVYALGSLGDRLLAGTLGGLSILENGEVRENFTTRNSRLEHNWITAIVPFHSDWFVGTYGAGVLRLDAEGNWSSFSDFSAPFVVNPNAMAATESRVYAGTLQHGLSIYNKTSRRWTRVTAGLPSVNVTALTLDDGYLYLGTDNGLVRIREKSIETQ